MAGVLALVVLAGCSGDSDDSESGSTTTAPEAEELDILVTNDDGFAAEGIDAVVEALRELPNVEITVTAPAGNRSGSGSQTTPGALTATEETTKSGYPVAAVDGFPADSVNYALANGADPDVVVAGINEGQNLGPFSTISGTVGAAKAAATEGIPALAASQGIGEGIEFETAAQYVVEWVTAHRDALVERTALKEVVSLNVPTCSAGSVRGLRQEPLAATNADAIGTPSDCESTATEFDDDIAAFIAGFATVTQLTATGETVTSSTTWPASG